MLEKRVAFITGGSRGIGRAIAIRLAQEQYHTIINYRSKKREAEATLKAVTDVGGSGLIYPFDITDRKVTDRAMKDITEKHRIRALILCAGIRNDELMIFMSEEQWDTVIDTNLSSFYNVVKPVVKQMVLNRRGRIVVISSTAGESGLSGQVNYSAAKAGVIGATKSLAMEYAKRNVLVNAITPGFIKTDMTENINEEKALKSIPMNRFGKPEEVAAAVSFLVSDDASYITGQVLGVNGGVYM